MLFSPSADTQMKAWPVATPGVSSTAFGFTLRPSVPHVPVSTPPRSFDEVPLM